MCKYISILLSVFLVACQSPNSPAPKPALGVTIAGQTTGTVTGYNLVSSSGVLPIQVSQAGAVGAVHVYVTTDGSVPTTASTSYYSANGGVITTANTSNPLYVGNFQPVHARALAVGDSLQATADVTFTASLVAITSTPSPFPLAVGQGCFDSGSFGYSSRSYSEKVIANSAGTITVSKANNSLGYISATYLAGGTGTGVSFTGSQTVAIGDVIQLNINPGSQYRISGRNDYLVAVSLN